MKYSRKRSFRRAVLQLFFASLCCTITIEAWSQIQQLRYPYAIDFRSTQQPLGIKLPVMDRNKAEFTENGLILTSNTDQFGAVLLENVSFNSVNGIEIEFEYSMYNGMAYDGVYGDGFSVFLYDSQSAESIGAEGGGLGYAYRRAERGEPTAKGLEGAYLGIGLDEYGNFKQAQFSTIGRVNGIARNFKTEKSSHLTMRGAEHPTGLKPPKTKGFSGYPVLITQSTNFSTSSSGAILREDGSGKYQDLPSLSIENSFDLRPDQLSQSKNDSNYRKALITLMPHKDGGFNISVKIQHGDVLSTVIDKYHYKTSLVYAENANSSGNWESRYQGPHTLHQLDAQVPESFKIGFAASTGSASQTHLIRDLVLTLPYMAETRGDSLRICGNYSKSFIIKPFDNDIIYNGSLTGEMAPTSGNDRAYIDFESFRFESETGKILGTVYEEPGKGKWEYNSNTGQVHFKPDDNFCGQVTIFYSIKGFSTNGGPFGQEDYRSAPTKIHLEMLRCNAISNPHQVSQPN